MYLCHPDIEPLHADIFLKFIRLVEQTRFQAPVREVKVVLL
jgi:hypothetical protein